MNTSLYHLSSELEAINDELRLSEGELTPELEEKLESCNLAINDKVSGIIKWSINLEGREKAIDAEIFRLMQMKKSVSTLHDRLREYVHASMLRADIQKVELPTMTISVQKNPPSLELVDIESVPAKYVTIKTEKVIDRRGMLEALKAGEVMACARLRTDKTHLKVK